MRFAILGDIHANLHALHAVLADASAQGVTHHAPPWVVPEAQTAPSTIAPLASAGRMLPPTLWRAVLQSSQKTQKSKRPSSSKMKENIKNLLQLNLKL